MSKGILMLAMAMLLVFAAACGNGGSGGETGNAPAESANGAQENGGSKPAEEEAKLSGDIVIDGSSTVYPLTEAAAEEFNKEHPDVRVTVGVSGTGGGFEKFAAGEIAIADASRPIKDEEAQKAKDGGVDFIELSVAYDGLSVVINKENDWVDHLTVEELNKIFAAGSTVKTWADVREGFPAEPITLFSPGADSGTYDYFNEAILDKKGIRNDDLISFSEDDNTLVQGVAGNKGGIGYFGFAYFEENADKLKVVPIEAGNGPVEPTLETIKNGSYSPLSRPLYIYVNKAELERPEVKAFVQYYIDNIGSMAAEVGYVPLPDEQYAKEAAKIEG
ncbi:PstS family phosphate ABC transporter substrate-binding protein [Paenibacillus cisolokensis]|uniref:PstS family phosphate ABC transporter substrate-binding protein n=1 Tax=Paenibacillus cisolokensis TaxID=1658519 RepID=UPI003D29757D